MWRSKLNNEYPKEFIDKKDKEFQARLNTLRGKAENRRCADCDANGTVWAIVNLGTFVCLQCASRHRNLGTHISKPKGCTGTYLWGPDEIEAMERMGNSRAQDVYGGAAFRPNSGASEEEWKSWLTERYERRKWQSAAPPARRVDVKVDKGLASKPFSSKRMETPSQPQKEEPQQDLISFDSFDERPCAAQAKTTPAKSTVDQDFFAQFGVI